MTASRPAPGGARVSDLLESATRLFRASLLKCLPMGMLAVSCAQLPHIYWLASAHAPGQRAHYDLNFDLLTLLATAIELWLIGAMMLRQRAVVLGAPLLAAAELRIAGRRVPAILLASMLAAVSVAAGLALLLVPGLFLLNCYAVLLPVVLFDGAGPLAALTRCVRLMRPLWWQALTALVFAALAFFLVGVLVFAALLAVLSGLLAGNGPAFTAIDTAANVAFGALFLVYLSALLLVLHSAASSSA